MERGWAGRPDELEMLVALLPTPEEEEEGTTAWDDGILVSSLVRDL